MKDDTKEAAIREYPFLSPENAAGPRRLSGAALAAKNMRILLKHQFPGVKFRIRSETFSGGDSVDINWSGLPTGPEEDVVEQVVGKFKDGLWDGQNDLYVNHSSGVGFRAAFGDAKHIRARAEFPSVEEVTKCADVNARFRDGTTLLHRAVKRDFVELVGALLHAGADMNARTESDNETALMMAARNGSMGTVRLLLDGGADVNAANRVGQTALLYAITGEKGYTDTVRLLLDRGADVNAQCRGSQTALMMAAQTGSVSTVKLLLDRGADVNVRDKDGDTVAVLMATGKYNTAMDAILRAHSSAVKLAEAIRGAAVPKQAPEQSRRL